jgi:hypothetical protein
MIVALADFTEEGVSFKKGDEVRQDCFDADHLMQPLVDNGLVEVVPDKAKKPPVTTKKK